MRSRLSLTGPGRGGAGIAAYAALALVAICFALPFFWLVFASVNRSASLSARFPTSPTAHNFVHVLSDSSTLKALWNGLLLAGGAALITASAAALAAYPLSRYNLRFAKPFLYTILFGGALPITAIIVPAYGLFVRTHLVDSIPGTILFLSATSLPYSIWIMKGFMDGVPISLEEAAWVDGASTLRSLRYVVLPLMGPGLAVAVLLTFVAAWGNFIVPFILLLSPSKQPVAVGIYQFFSSYGTVSYGYLAAYAVVYTIPIAGLYVFLSRSIGGAFRFGGAVTG